MFKHKCWYGKGVLHIHCMCGHWGITTLHEATLWTLWACLFTTTHTHTHTHTHTMFTNDCLIVWGHAHWTHPVLVASSVDRVHIQDRDSTSVVGSSPTFVNAAYLKWIHVHGLYMCVLLGSFHVLVPCIGFVWSNCHIHVHVSVLSKSSMGVKMTELRI